MREWPASTDQRGGSRGLTARARAVWISPPALSNIVLAELTMGSMAARPCGEGWREVSLTAPKQMGWQLADHSSLHIRRLTSGLIWAGMLANSGLDAKALRLSTASSSGAVAAWHWARFSSVKAPSSACRWVTERPSGRTVGKGGEAQVSFLGLKARGQDGDEQHG